MARQSCLEKRSIEARHEQMVRSDYNPENQYNENHPDARATGDAQGKGTGHGGHTHWLPNCEAEPNVFRYDNFDTDPLSNAGNNVDNDSRNASFVRSLYNPEHPYSADEIDTSANVAEGQYVIS